MKHRGARRRAPAADVAPIEHHHALAAPSEFERDEAAGDATPRYHDVAAAIAEQRRVHRQQSVASRPEGVTIVQVHGQSSIRRIEMGRRADARAAERNLDGG
jgi:hypothetical protein